MKYLLFGGEYYYPDGGWNDFLGHGKELDVLSNSECLKNKDWWHIIEIKTGDKVAGSADEYPN